MDIDKLNQAAQALSPVDFDALLGEMLQERIAERLLPLKKHLASKKAAATKAANKPKETEKKK